MTVDIVVRDDDHEPTLLFNPAAWVKDAACRGLAVNLFVTERGELINDAKRVCATCTVSDECLRYALDNGIRYGVWGGTSERDRRALRREGRVSRLTAACGTISGYERHRKEGSTPCPSCRLARSEYKKAWKASRLADGVEGAA